MLTRRGFIGGAVGLAASVPFLKSLSFGGEVSKSRALHLINELSSSCGDVTSFFWDSDLSLGATVTETYESLYLHLCRASRGISTVRVNLGLEPRGANFVIAPPNIVDWFETATAGFSGAPGRIVTNLGVEYIGTVNSRWRLYNDPLLPENVIVTGYSERIIGYHNELKL
jgi:hypothetical protein